jgi:hypothetical protein
MNGTQHGEEKLDAWQTRPIREVAARGRPLRDGFEMATSRRQRTHVMSQERAVAAPLESAQNRTSEAIRTT